MTSPPDQPTNPSTTGSLGSYHWAEDWEADLGATEVVAALAGRLVGLRGVCVSWDAGLLDPARLEQPGWSLVAAYALSPELDEATLQAWPTSGGDWDEWYLFSEPPLLRGRLHAFCNYPALSVGQAAELREWPTGFDLQAQLERNRPRLVVGEGTRLFALTPELSVVEEFQGLCARHRSGGETSEA